MPTSQIAVAPVGAMPEPMQTIFLVVSIALALGVFIYGIVVARRYGSAIPILLVIGGFCAIPLEPVVTYLGHAMHPTEGSIALFHTVDRTIPWHIALGYTFGFGLVYLLMYTRAMDGTLTRAFIWKTGAVAVTCYYFGEIAGVSTGLWVYFEPQPIWIWKLTAPPTWSFLNSTCELMGSSLIMFLLPHLKGPRQLLVLVLPATGAFMGHFGAGWPWYNVINSDAPRIAMHAAALVSIGLCLMLWWIASLLATTHMPHEEELRG